MLRNQSSFDGSTLRHFGNGAVMFPLNDFVEKTLQMLH